MKDRTPVYVLGAALLLMLMLGSSAWADSRHKHPKIQQDIEDLFNRDRIQQTLIWQEQRRNTTQHKLIKQGFDLIATNNTLIQGIVRTGALNRGNIALLDNRVSSLENGFAAATSRLEVFESHMLKAQTMFSRGIAAASALDLQAPVLGGTRISINSGYYNGYLALAVGSVTKWDSKGEPTFSVGLASAGSEVAARIGFAFSLDGK